METHLQPGEVNDVCLGTLMALIIYKLGYILKSGKVTIVLLAATLDIQRGDKGCYHLSKNYKIRYLLFSCMNQTHLRIGDNIERTFCRKLR